MKLRFNLSALRGAAAIMLFFTPTASAQTSNFTYTGAVQTYTVPSAVTSLAVEMYGAKGGNAYSDFSIGGNGGLVQCTLNVTPGQVLYIYVGGEGGSAIGSGIAGAGYNGGGVGGPYGGGGGGATDIRTDNGAPTAINRLVVAGGGGGGSWNCADETGGAGGGLTGGNGEICNASDPVSTGQGGTQTGGGAGATSGGENGTIGTGGNYVSGVWGSAGGGGYYGGGSGSYGSGGGGSSYTDATFVSSVIHTQGYSGSVGNGFVSLTVLNAIPEFVNGATQNLSVCVNVTSVNVSPALAMIDADNADMETFSIIYGPTHGTLTGLTATLTATSGIDEPIGVIYSPTPGYIGLDSFQVEVTDGIDADTTTIYMTVNPLPTAYDVTGSGSYCAGSAGKAIGLSNTAIGVTYKLYDGSTFITDMAGDGSGATFGTYTAATTYTATATDNTSGCMNNMTGDATVTITAVSVPAVTITNTPDDTVCAGTAVTFTANPVNGGGAPLYSWSVDGTPVGTGDTYNYTPSNGDIVSVTLTTNVVCPSTPTVNDDLTMVVYSNEVPAVTISASNTTICQHTPVTFSVATSAHGGTAPVYTWYKGTTSTGITGSSYTYQPADNDVVSVRLNSNYRCPTVNNVPSNNITMQVDSVFLPAVSITTNKGLQIAPGESVTFTAAVTNAGTATPLYQWYVNKVAINGATSSTYTNNTLAHNDSVTCRVRAAGICNDATPTFNSVRISVTTGFVHTTLESADIQLAPNPNNGTFYVRGSLNTNTDAEVQLEVTNMLVQVIYTNQFTAQDGNIDAQVQPSYTLPNGMYLLTVRTGAERKAFRFVVKQ